MTANQPIITYDYDFSPYGSKIRMLLALTGLPHKRCDVPAVLPRPQLESMGITYRRIPVLAVGKDIYCDTSLIVHKILELQGPQGGLHQHPASHAFEQWANWAFSTALTLAPAQLLTPEFVKDRETIFRMPFPRKGLIKLKTLTLLATAILARPDFAQLRPSGLGAFASIMSTIENDFLASGYSYVGGRNEPSTADVHVAWFTQWYLTRLEVAKEPGFEEVNFPRTYAWLKRLPYSQPEALDAEDSRETILRSDYTETSIQHQPNDPLQAFVNREVNVENAE